MHTHRLRPAATLIFVIAGCVLGSSTEMTALSADSALEIAADSTEVVEQGPVLIEFVKPVYPPNLLAQGIEGEVLLDILIDSAGMVESSTIAKSLYPALDTAALRASLKFRFSPARLHDQPVAVMLRYAYRFSIEKEVQLPAEWVNLRGTIFEKGTKTPLPYAIIAVDFSGQEPSRKRRDRSPPVDSLPYHIPLNSYIRKIGEIQGQQLDSCRIQLPD